MPSHHLRPLPAYEPTRRATPRRRRALVSVPPPDPQLTLDLELPTGRPSAAGRPRQLSGTLDRRQVARLLTALLEAYDGLRPVSQVRPIVSADLFPNLLPAERGQGVRHRVRTVHLCHPAEGAIEACATVECGRRMLALAVRFERSSGGWHCTRFNLLEPGTTRLRITA